MARFTSNGQTHPSLTSHLRDINQRGCDVMNVLVSQEADVLLANLAYGRDSEPYASSFSFERPDCFDWLCVIRYN